MVMGWFGSALAEFAFCGAAGNLLHSTTGRLEFFAMAPFAVFAPVWLVLLRRWMREQETWGLHQPGEGRPRTAGNVARDLAPSQEHAQPERALTTGHDDGEE